MPHSILIIGLYEDKNHHGNNKMVRLIYHHLMLQNKSKIQISKARIQITSLKKDNSICSRNPPPS